MVQQPHRWNISQKNGEVYLHKYIIEILRDNKQTLQLSDLIVQLNQRTKHIKLQHHGKRKPFSVYVRCMFGSMYNFLDNYIFYKVSKHGADIRVELLDSTIPKDKIPKHKLDEYKEWVVVNEEDEFMFV